MKFKKINCFLSLVISKNSVFFSSIYFFFIAVNILFYFFFISKYPHYIDFNHNLILSSLDHSFGEIIENIIYNGKFSQKMFNFDLDFYLVKMPFGPYFLSFIYFFITKNFLLIILIKNLFFFTILICVAKAVLRYNFHILILLIILFSIPFNLYNFLRIIPEEGFVNYLVVIFFLLFNSDIKNRTILLTISLILLFFSKGSTCFFIYPTVLYFLYFEKKKTPLIAIAVCFLIWGSYAYLKVNKFISPFSLSSVGGMTISTALNSEFNNIYPLQSPDILYPKVFADNHNFTQNLTNEIDVDKIFKQYALNYILNNKKEFFVSIVKKLKVIFFNIRKDAQLINGSGYNKIQYSNFFNIFTLYFAILIILLKLIKKNAGKKDFFYLLFCSSYLFPFMVGILYTRHLVPIYMISALYLYFELLVKNKNFNFLNKEN